MTTTLDNVFELVLVLDGIRRRCALEGPWRFQVVMPAVLLRGSWRVGLDVSLLWAEGPDGTPALHGHEPRQFMAEHWGTTPQLDWDAPVWLFNTMASGPLSQRYTRLTRDQHVATVKHAGTQAVSDVLRLREKTRALAPQDTNAPPWMACPICGPVEDACLTHHKAGFFVDGKPIADHFLPILGAPHFRDSTGARDWCIKRCLVCRTHYHWKGSYEYLVNGGTEDEVTITRLKDGELAAWLDLVQQRVSAVEADAAARKPGA